ncbi:MAG: (2Fe-2S)-binding protein [Cyclobacteriaceae bacterium]|nr:(2Fe-2S)-binding protein [Cyclobacteriaceae bacterium]
MNPVTLKINGKSHSLEDVPQDMPLLWALRDLIGLTGTKYGCGMAQCGACTVHMEGTAVRSCSITAAAAEGKEITTIEGLSENGDHPVQSAWMEANVPQCGYCQTGQIMNAASFLDKNPNPSLEEINQAMAGNLCRCGTYNRIREAIQIAVEKGGNS